MSTYATPMQELSWYWRAYDPSLPWATVRFSRMLRGDLDVAALRGSFRGVIARHEALRTTFDCRGEQLLRVVHSDDQRAELELVDLVGLDERQRESSIAATRADLAAPFDPLTGPLIRGKLVRTSPDRWTFLLALDHIVFDGMSMRIFYQDLWACYRSLTSKAEPVFATQAVPFSEFADFQQRAISGTQYAHQRAYWEEKLRDARVEVDVPLIAPREAVTSFRLGTVPFAGLPALTGRFDAFARRHRATTFSVLTAAAAVALASFGEEDTILMASFWANRHRFRNKALIGLVADLLPLSIAVDRSVTVETLVRSTQHSIAEAFSNGDISPLLTTGRPPVTLNPPRDSAGTPYGPEVWINYVEGRETGPTDTTDRAMDFELPSEEFPLRDGWILQFLFKRSRAGLAGSVLFNSKLVSEEGAATIARKTERALDAMIGEPHAKVRHLIDLVAACR